MRRGRPPYPDILTPREQEVLALLREELTNQQIADRLGITLYGARYHVSEILSKLGVTSREEAARWQPERQSDRRWFAALTAPFAKLGSISGYKLVGGGAIGAAGVGMALLALGVLASGMRDESESRLGKIAYVQDGDIWTMELPAGAPVLVLDDADADYAGPAWSASGKWLTYVRHVSGQSEVWVARHDGSDARRLDARAGNWSPIDDRLAYVNGWAELVVEAADGSGQRRVVSLLQHSNEASVTVYGDPLWSRDGRYLAVGIGEGSTKQSLMRLEVATGELVELYGGQTPASGLEQDGPVWPAVWAADGSVVYFWRAPVRSASMQADGWPLWAAASDGSGASSLAIQTLVYTDFLTALPNSNQVVVVEGAGRLASMNKQLQSIEFSPTQRPTPDGALQPDLEWRNTPLSVRRTGEIVELLPDVSSDGRTIAYVAQPWDESYDPDSPLQRRIWLMDVDGSKQQRLTSSEDWEERPQWSVDGDYILYVAPSSHTSPSTPDEPRYAALVLRDLNDGHQVAVLSSLAYEINNADIGIWYYGHFDWDELFDWWQP